MPDAFFMIVVDEQEGKLRTLALIIPQEAPPSGDLASYLTSVSEIQQRTHLDFFRELDDAAEHQVEEQRAGRVW